jgi:hypothetical protein
LIVQHNTRCRIVTALAGIKGEMADADYQFIGYMVVVKGRGGLFLTISQKGCLRRFDE